LRSPRAFFGVDRGLADGRSGLATATVGAFSADPVPLATDLFDYALPAHLIAQTPAARRDQSRLMVIDRRARAMSHHRFADLPRFLQTGDMLFRNVAAVLPARLHAKRPTGGKVECFLLRPVDADHTWLCLVKPGRRLPVGATFAGERGGYTGTVLGKEPDGTVLVRFDVSDGETIATVANRLGDVPLPPYIERKHKSGTRDDDQRARDIERYQTVYADRRRQVAVAAPTAGLHFTPELLANLTAQGIRFLDSTLHVGLGTFQPIATATVGEHAIHRELYEIPGATQRALFPPLAGRRVAVGTTTVRMIEDFLARHAAPQPGEGTWIAEAGIFIYPPREFLGVDALITNFHQPRSTLLCLVAAFLTPGSLEGIEWVRRIYAEAMAREYRFFSYGDAMLVV
jgi:S-adenosylmethionine:tRNA ribosyltransferase-isomerase